MLLRSDPEERPTPRSANTTTLSKYQSKGCSRDALGWSVCTTVRQHEDNEIIASGLLLAVNNERVDLLEEGVLKNIELTSERYMVRKYRGIHQ